MQRYTGLLGETVVVDGLNTLGYGLPVPTYHDGDDGGCDLVLDGVRVDVKTMLRSVTADQPHYANNIIAAQVTGRADVYCCCSINRLTRELTVCGVTTPAVARQFLKKAGTVRERDGGEPFTLLTDTYEVPTRWLTQVGSWRELADAIVRVAVPPVPDKIRDPDLIS